MKNLRLFIALLITATAATYYLVRSSQDSRSASGQEEVRDRQGADTPRKAPGTPTGRGRSWQETDDPAKDGWDTEVFAGEAKKQLEALGRLLAEPGGIGAVALADLITDDFACGPLSPAGVTPVFADKRLVVDRVPVAPSPRTLGDGAPGEDELPYRGAGGLVGALRPVAGPFAGATGVRFEFKIFRVVVVSPDEILTRQYFSVSGRTGAGMLEQHATWDVAWAPGGSGAPPRMRWIRVVEFEQAASRQRDGPLFVDITGPVLGGNSGYADQFLRGANHWFERLQDPSRAALLANPGLAVGDVDGDGLDDLYVCQEAGLPNRLFIQNPDGTAREASESWGVDWLESSRSALLVDLDNDSDQDLVVAIFGGVVVAENVGQGHLRLREVLPGGEDMMSLSAVDYDMDGRLDIYVCAYYQNRTLESHDTGGFPGASVGFVAHDANNGGNNILFQNQISRDGDWHFEDVTGEAGLDANNHRYSLAASWEDFDNDGDPDLYVANDYGRDHLYRNDLICASAPGAAEARPQFVDVSEPARVEDSATGMSITWGDYDRDGWMDALVSNMWSSAGQRITYQDRFQADAPHELKRRFQRLARGNTLLRNRGDGTFADRSRSAGIEMGRWAWGSHFVDLNNDGWEDLLVSNGYITTEDSGDL